MATAAPLPRIDVGAEVRRQMVAGIAAAGPHVARTVLELARILGSPQRGSAVRKAFWQENADDVRRSVVASYRATVHRGAYVTPPGYRRNDTGKNKRYAGGALDKALNDRKNYVVTTGGLALFDEQFLDSKARQWYRLNFGTAPHSRTQETYQIGLGRGVTFAELTLPGAPSGEMVIPDGFFTESGEFHPKHRRPGYRYIMHLKETKPTAGVEGRGFLDAGVRRLALNLSGDSGKRGTSLLGLHNRLFYAGVSTVRPPARISQGLVTLHMVLTNDSSDVAA